jgi:hypothetical protein
MPSPPRAEGRRGTGRFVSCFIGLPCGAVVRGDAPAAPILPAFGLTLKGPLTITTACRPAFCGLLAFGSGPEVERWRGARVAKGDGL